MGIRIIFLLTLFVFSTLLLVSIATAQAWLTVTTEFETYEQGDVVEITLQGPIGAEVMLEVRDPLGELIDSKYVVIWPERTVNVNLPLSEECTEGVYTVTASFLTYTVQTRFTVLRKPSPILVLAPPGSAQTGEEVTVIGFVYPGLSLPLEAYIKLPGGEWIHFGEIQSNASGWLTFSVKPDAEGIYEVKVRYRGSPELAPVMTIANFTVMVSKPPGCRVEPLGTKQLNETAKLACRECEAIIARTIRGDRLYKPGETVKLDTPGPWFIYPLCNGALGTPVLTLVKSSISMHLETPEEVEAGKPFTLKVRLSPPTPMLRVEVLGEEGRILAAASTRVDGVSIMRLNLTRIGKLRIHAELQPTGVFEASFSQPVLITVRGREMHVWITVTDAEGEKLHGAIIAVDSLAVEATEGVAWVPLKAGEYNLTVLWHGFTVYKGEQLIENFSIIIPTWLYSIKVKVIDFIGEPAQLEQVELLNGSVLLAAVTTNEDGEVAFTRLPPGTYTVRARGIAVTLKLPDEREATLQLPLPAWFVTAVALTLLTAISLIIVEWRASGEKTGVKIIREKSQPTSEQAATKGFKSSASSS
ncbi:MAG: carboxypeptidase-like regulatory domain-containing protein [Thermofilaceae archaeon]